MSGVKSPTNLRASDPANAFAVKDSADVLQSLGTSLAGLTEDEVAARLEKHGPNEVAREKRHDWFERLVVAV
ncbi:MAG TPA: cation-transporting P-type ATPase, partial [Verrucomicrobiae bacterium]|nr:cation-transporting P-type ATPase [Verrucomicrobiae bacterium]